MNNPKDTHFKRYFTMNPDSVAVSARQIEYIDIAPRPIDVQIPLWEYFERIKRYRADRWQKDFCNRLQEAAVNRRLKRFWEIYHAEGQLGKTSILSQAFPAWLFGHDPLFRYALATYNVTRSQAHSEVTINILNSPVHKDIFPDKDGWLLKNNASKEKWKTRARAELNDGQDSFNPVGLQSGLTGSGFDWLVIDDPYAESKDAFSETIREGLQNFWEYTVMSRVGLHSNVTGMFHRYHVADLAGYLLDTGDFNYIRYASECDGDYIHDETGQRFPDPLGRAPGELISPERRPAQYYERVKKNKRVWNSMFQGRPTSEEGDFFDVSKIRFITPEQGEQRKAECVAFVRAYDNAATFEGGDYTSSMLGGIRPNGHVTVFHSANKQLDAARRLQLVSSTARTDGPNVTIRIPEDPGAAGKTEAWFTTQHLEDYTVVAKPVSGAKEMRAINGSAAVNVGEIEFVLDTDLDEDDKWNDFVKRCMRDFPMGKVKDPIDAFSDMYNELYEMFRKGAVLTNFRPQRNLVRYSDFAARFKARNKQGQMILKIPKDFRIYVGVKITADQSRPNSAVICARASANAFLDDALFIVSEYKEYTANFYDLFDWINQKLSQFCEVDEETKAIVYLHPDSEEYLPTIRQKVKQRDVVLFDQDKFAGLTELNWHLLPTEKANPFNPVEQASRLYFMVSDSQVAQASNEPNANGLYHARQEVLTWNFNEKGEPSAVGGVMECVRLITYNFRAQETPLTYEEKVTIEVKQQMPDEVLQRRLETADEARRGHVLTEQQLLIEKTRERLKQDDAGDVPGYSHIG